MTKLTDLDTILLSTAAQRDTGSVLPPPESIGDVGARLDKSIAGLIRRRLVEERDTIERGTIHREDGDRTLGLFITDAGKTAIGIEDASERPEPAAADPAPVAPRVTKAATVLTLLSRENGATLADLIAATGWLPHTTRAALTGLRKKGHVIEKSKRDGVTRYRVAEVAA